MAFVPFAATVGAWLGGSAALGGAAILAGGAALGSSVSSMSSARKASKQQMPQMPGSNAPTVEETKAKAAAQSAAAMKQKKMAIARSKTIFTSPLGLSEDASTAKKTLLGQ